MPQRHRKGSLKVPKSQTLSGAASVVIFLDQFNDQVLRYTASGKLTVRELEAMAHVVCYVKLPDSTSRSGWGVFNVLTSKVLRAMRSFTPKKTLLQKP